MIATRVATCSANILSYHLSRVYHGHDRTRFINDTLHHVPFEHFRPCPRFFPIPRWALYRSICPPRSSLILIEAVNHGIYITLPYLTGIPCPAVGPVTMCWPIVVVILWQLYFEYVCVSIFLWHIYKMNPALSKPTVTVNHRLVQDPSKQDFPGIAAIGERGWMTPVGRRLWIGQYTADVPHYLTIGELRLWYCAKLSTVPARCKPNESSVWSVWSVWSVCAATVQRVTTSRCRYKSWIGCDPVFAWRTRQIERRRRRGKICKRVDRSTTICILADCRAENATFEWVPSAAAWRPRASASR